jgi:hypothetical protein
LGWFISGGIHFDSTGNSINRLPRTAAKPKLAFAGHHLVGRSLRSPAASIKPGFSRL